MISFFCFYFLNNQLGFNDCHEISVVRYKEILTNRARVPSKAYRLKKPMPACSKLVNGLCDNKTVVGIWYI